MYYGLQNYNFLRFFLHLLKDVFLERIFPHLLLSYSEIKFTEDRRDICLILSFYLPTFKISLCLCACYNTSSHKRGGLKQTKNLFSHRSGSCKSEISFMGPKSRFLKGHTPSNSSRVQSILCLFQLLAVASILWLVAETLLT